MKTKPSNLIYIIPAIAIAYFMFAHYNQGLFFGNSVNFEKPIYGSILFSSILMLFSVYFLFATNKLQLRQLVTIILISLLPISYFIAQWFAVTSHLATDMVLVAFGWAAFFMAAYVFYSSKPKADWVVHGILAAGYILVIIGFLAWFGHIVYEDAVLQGRLSNVFQYPNTYAVLLLGLFFAQLHLISTKSEKYASYFHMFMIVPTLVSFLLTLSRGAIVVFAVVLIVHLLLIKGSKQFITIIYLVSAGIISILTMYGIHAIQGTSHETWLGWLMLIVASVLNAAMMVFLTHIIEKKLSFEHPFFAKRFVAPVAIVVFVGIAVTLVLSQSSLLKILPDALENRIRTITLADSSFDQRLTYYKDAWQVAKDYPLFGSGGGGWSKLYWQYQSYPYIGNHSHSFYMQILNETGFFGLLVLMALLVWVYGTHVKRQWKEEHSRKHVYFLLATPILLHSLLDFHMSYVYMASLVFFCLGAMASGDGGLTGSSLKLDKATKVPSYMPASLVAIVSLVVLFTSVRFVSAANDFSAGIEHQDYGKLLSAVDTRPNHPTYREVQAITLLNEYKQSGDGQYLAQAEEIADRMLEREKFDLQLTSLKSQILELQGNMVESVQLLEAFADKAPWNQTVNDMLFYHYANLGQIDPVWWEKALERHAYLKTAIEDFKDKGLYRKRFFNMNFMDSVVAQIKEVMEAAERKN